MIGGKVSKYLDPIVKFYFIIFQAHFKPTHINTVIEKLNWLMPLAIKVSYFRCFKTNISNAISSDAIKWIIINIKKEKILCYSVKLYFSLREGQEKCLCMIPDLFVLVIWLVDDNFWSINGLQILSHEK